jgi:hypothetical protein
VSRGSFFAHASAVMRSVIVDHVRAKGADKRGGGHADVTLSTSAIACKPMASKVAQPVTYGLAEKRRRRCRYGDAHPGRWACARVLT